jgi:hypothetical protein
MLRQIAHWKPEVLNTEESSAGKHRSNTTLNYMGAHNLQTEFKEGNFIKEYHAAPSELQKIIEELQYEISLQYTRI